MRRDVPNAGGEHNDMRAERPSVQMQGRAVHVESDVLLPCRLQRRGRHGARGKRLQGLPGCRRHMGPEGRLLQLELHEHERVVERLLECV